MRWLLAVATVVVLAAASSPPLSISLETSWPAPPLVLEILETVYDESPSSYFPLLSHIAPLLAASSDQPLSDERTLELALDLIEEHSLLPKPSSLSTFHLALGLHTSVPRIEAGYSWYASSVDEAKLGVAECEGSWVEWRGKGFCEAEGLRRDVEMSIEEGLHHSESQPDLLPFDHISPSDDPTSTAIFYYDPLSSSSADLLRYLSRHSSQYPSFQFVVRYRPSRAAVPEAERRKTPLTGYGVEMALKKTDYLVVDDRAPAGSASEHVQGGVAGSSHNASSTFGEVLGDDPWAELSVPITSEEMRDLGLQASSLIMASSDPLDALLHLSQDFPKYSAALARKVVVPDNIRKKQAQILQRGPEPARMYINGKAFGPDELNAFSLLKHIRTERDIVLSLTSLGLTPRQAVELISNPMIGQAQVEDDPSEGMVDASDRPEGGGVITWWNDVEKDKRYKNWPNNIRTYLRPMYPGQLHTVRRNTWNLVFVLDLALAPSLDTVANSLSQMIQRGVPLRFGLVPMFDNGVDDMSYKMAKVFRYIVRTFGRGATRDFLQELILRTPTSPSHPGVVKLEVLQQTYEALVSNSPEPKKGPALSFDAVLAQPFDAEWLQSVEAYTKRLLATKQDHAPGHLFINGKYVPMGGHWTAVVQSELASQLVLLQEHIVAESVDPAAIATFFYDQPSVSTRRSKLIVPGIGVEHPLKVVNLLKVFEGEAARLAADFVYTPDGARGAPVTIWVVGDLDSAYGRQVVEDALHHLQSKDCASRLGFIHLPSSSSASTSSSTNAPRLSTILYQLIATNTLSRVSPSELLQLVREVAAVAVNDDNLDQDGRIFSEDGSHAQEILQGTPLHALTSAGWSETDKAAGAEFWRVSGIVAERLGIQRKGTGPWLLVNGRLVGPITAETFLPGDFDALEAYEHRKRVKPVIDVLKTMYDDITAFDRATLANLISSASSVISSAYYPDEAQGIFTPLQISRTQAYQQLDADGDMSFSLGDTESSILHVAAILDPVSETAQKWSGILKTLSRMENVKIEVFLEPDLTSPEVTLKRFYRYLLHPTLEFDVDGNIAPSSLVFSSLPETPIFTLALDTPPSWIVSPLSSPYDLDNLLLSSLPSSPQPITFTLKQLLLEGHAREANNSPPRGLQLQLTKPTTGEVVSDTMIMANLGYLQFKARPGVYDLGIRPGRGEEVYELESVGAHGWDSEGVEVEGRRVVISGLEGGTVLPRFKRREGMEAANVLVEAVQRETFAGSVFNRMKSLVGLGGETKPKSKRHADINIFTVASGLLYERFASIMILSVMKNTESSVKFWFIENFLSPSFIAFIPHMAKEYGFEYEFVTYKWPHWLRAQTEKQRIIWAYKILFLDVLFPMDLDKVIFVDADQIVRADMKELVDVDLHGQVYGYAPMGDSRTEMEGFRFWKTGYWKDALRGRPYHISALYVVDLKRFRQLATGDRLRGQYHALSADPNSLANLDQDLPNSMQDQIPIFTLDQDWLWCQTWCSDESLQTAKTIDLCQNPLTKEPKLVRARQIPEWDSYDQEIAAFAKRLEEQQGGALAADVEELAGEGRASREVDALEEVVDDRVPLDLEETAGMSDEQEEARGHVGDEL